MEANSLQPSSSQEESSNQNLPTANPILKTRANFALIVPVGIFLLVLVIVAGAYLLGNINRFSTKDLGPTSQISPNPKMKGSSGDEYRLAGSEVIKVNGQSNVLFKNVEGVSGVRLGPDGKTLHFKLTGKFEAGRYYCGNLEEKDVLAPTDYPSPPPNQPPWDFKRLGHAYTIRGCEGDGYLANSDLFVYLQLRGSQEGDIHYEDLASGKKGQVAVPADLLSGFDNSSPEKMNDYWSQGITGIDGYRYYYPHQDVIVDNKLVLAFARLIVALDIQKNKFIGGRGISYQDSDFPIIGTSFYFLNEKSLPFIIIEGRWEGPPIFAGLIDVSGNDFKIIKLASLDKRSIFDFGIQPAAWENDRLLFNFADFEGLKIPDSYLNKDLTQVQDVEIDNLNRQLENVFMGKSGYEQVKCELRPGMYTAACEGLKQVLHYQYTANQGLVRLK